MTQNEILKKKIKVLAEMEKILKLMDYIKVIDTALSRSTDPKFMNYWNTKFTSNVYLLRDECVPLREVLVAWFKIEEDNNLDVNFNLRASYKAMEGF